MKKNYVAPSLKVKEVKTHPLMDGSPLQKTSLFYGGDNSQDGAPTAAEANSRRGSWGNLWGEEE